MYVSAAGPAVHLDEPLRLGPHPRSSLGISVGVEGHEVGLAHADHGAQDARPHPLDLVVAGAAVAEGERPRPSCTSWRRHQVVARAARRRTPTSR